MCRKGIKESFSVHILKGEPTEFSDELDSGCKNKRQKKNAIILVSV